MFICNLYIHFIVCTIKNLENYEIGNEPFLEVYY